MGPNIAPFVLTIVILVVLILLGIFFYFLKVWIRALAAGARVSILNLALRLA